MKGQECSSDQLSSGTSSTYFIYYILLYILYIRFNIWESSSTVTTAQHAEYLSGSRSGLSYSAPKRSLSRIIIHEWYLLAGREHEVTCASLEQHVPFTLLVPRILYCFLFIVFCDHKLGAGTFLLDGEYIHACLITVAIEKFQNSKTQLAQMI